MDTTTGRETLEFGNINAVFVTTEDELLVYLPELKEDQLKDFTYPRIVIAINTLGWSMSISEFSKMFSYIDAYIRDQLIKDALDMWERAKNDR